MARTSFMSRLTLGILVALILFGVTFTFTTGLTSAVNGIAAYYGTPTAPFPQPFWELLLSFAVGFIPISIVVWDHQNSQKTGEDNRIDLLLSKLDEFLKEFKADKTGTAPRRGRSYDPDPGKRRGGLPKSIIRKYGISKRAWQVFRAGKRGGRRTHDPGYKSSLWRGPRGGHYFKGPRKKRYDPDPGRRLSAARSYARRAGTRAESFINRWATIIGALIGFAWPTYDAWTKYVKADPTMTLGRFVGWEPHPEGAPVYSSIKNEILTLFGQTSTSPIDYLKTKFTKEGEAWVIPFWLSLGTWLATTFAHKIGRLGKYGRIIKPLNKFSKGSLIATTIGALAIPGCPDVSTRISIDRSNPPQAGIRPLEKPYQNLGRR